MEHTMRGDDLAGIMGAWSGWYRPAIGVGLRSGLRRGLAMSGLDALIFGFVALVILDVVSLRFGRDSRSSTDPRHDWN
jgi:hypothetical protein